MIKIDEDADFVESESRHFLNAPECDACQKKFVIRVRFQNGEFAYCLNCFQHRYGTNETVSIMKTMDEQGILCWSTTVMEIPIEKYKKIAFVSNINAQKDRGLDKNWQPK